MKTNTYTIEAYNTTATYELPSNVPAFGVKLEWEKDLGAYCIHIKAGERVFATDLNAPTREAAFALFAKEAAFCAMDWEDIH